MYKKYERLEAAWSFLVEYFAYVLSDFCGQLFDQKESNRCFGVGILTIAANWLGL